MTHYNLYKQYLYDYIRQWYENAYHNAQHNYIKRQITTRQITT